MIWSDLPPNDANILWRTWFAWHLVRMRKQRTGGWIECPDSVWLEKIERRKYYPSNHTRVGACWMYRFPEGKP